MSTPDPDFDERVRAALSRLKPEDAIPHVRVVAWVTFCVLIAFAIVTGFTLFRIEDDTIRGALIGTWSTMAVSTVGFWVGSSSGGKLNKK